MSNLTPIPDDRPTSISKPHPDLDTFKSVFYWANAKPDTQIVALSGRKRINLADIHTLKGQVEAKLNLHVVENYIVSISFMLAKGNIRDYGSWAEFEREDWKRINFRTESINITWDMTITLPNFAIPQRHTLKLRIGNAIPPKDMLQLMFTSDDSVELAEAKADAVCKVDFVNQVLANELLLIVSNWYEGLHKVANSAGMEKFLLSNQKFILACIVNFTPVIIIYILYLYYPFLIAKGFAPHEINPQTLLTLLVLTMFIFTFGVMLGRYFAKIIDSKIDKFKNPTGFAITRGDELYNFEIKTKNKTNKSSIVKKFAIAILVGLFTVVFKYFLENYMTNQ